MPATKAGRTLCKKLNQSRYYDEISAQKSLSNL